MLLLDTNVWLDHYLAARPGHDDATALIEHALHVDMPLLYAVHTAHDVFYLIGALLKRAVREERGSVGEQDALAIRAIAWACVENMQDIATGVGADGMDIRLALKRRAFAPDLEDGLIAQAALRAGARYLVTSDKQLLAHADVAALCPADMLALLRTGTLC